jgi:putative phosphoesterase
MPQRGKPEIASYSHLVARIQRRVQVHGQQSGNAVHVLYNPPMGNPAIAHQRIEPGQGRLRLVVVADTHGNPHPGSAALITAERPDAIVHAGDIGDLSVLTELEKIAPVHAVRGNIDVRVERIPEALTLTVEVPGRSPLRVLVVHIGVIGPKLRGEVAALAKNEGASLVVCGHSHVPFIGRDKGIAVFNPGSVGPRRFALPIVFGVMEVDASGVKLRHVDCETGKTWAP